MKMLQYGKWTLISWVMTNEEPMSKYAYYKGHLTIEDIRKVKDGLPPEHIYFECRYVNNGKLFEAI